ncbi:tyrosine-type recombinase/integrase [Bacillus sp. JJ1764]|uniref:tyrosine-type recombinase/integrase n=1 Tax=Bacillus sp. JJ1764 TaxID=3122964 RepID=UPI002FFF58A7
MHIKKFDQYQIELGNKPTYINTLIKSLRSFYNYLVNEEYVSHNIILEIKFLNEEKVIINTFTDKEVAKMIDTYDFKSYLNVRNKVIIAMFVDTGIRMSELINLQSSLLNETDMKVFGKGS